jgi:hypothetical protein
MKNFKNKTKVTLLSIAVLTAVSLMSSVSADSVSTTVSSSSLTTQQSTVETTTTQQPENEKAATTPSSSSATTTSSSQPKTQVTYASSSTPRSVVPPKSYPNTYSHTFFVDEYNNFNQDLFSGTSEFVTAPSIDGFKIPKGSHFEGWEDTSGNTYQPGDQVPALNQMRFKAKWVLDNQAVKLPDRDTMNIPYGTVYVTNELFDKTKFPQKDGYTTEIDYIDMKNSDPNGEDFRIYNLDGKMYMNFDKSGVGTLVYKYIPKTFNLTVGKSYWGYSTPVRYEETFKLSPEYVNYHEGDTLDCHPFIGYLDKVDGKIYQVGVEYPVPPHDVDLDAAFETDEPTVFFMAYLPNMADKKDDGKAPNGNPVDPVNPELPTDKDGKVLPEYDHHMGEFVTPENGKVAKGSEYFKELDKNKTIPVKDNTSKSSSSKSLNILPISNTTKVPDSFKNTITKNETLPVTGDDHNMSFIEMIVGSLILLGTVSIAFFGRFKNN